MGQYDLDETENFFKCLAYVSSSVDGNMFEKLQLHKFPGSLQDSFSFYFRLVQHLKVSYQRSSQGLLPSPIFPEHVLSLVDLQAHARAFHFPVVI